MARRSGNRLKYQVEQALKSINEIGKSKKGFRDAGKDTGIHGIKQMKNVLSTSQNFAEWLRSEKRVKDLYQLKRSHYRDYIEYMKSKGVSNGYLINIETDLRLLSKGMEKASNAKGMKGREWVPKTRLIDTASRERPKDRSYTQSEINSFRERVSDDVKVAMDLQQAFGLRLREVANTRFDHIVEREGRLYWEAVRDREALNTAHGVTKAGRPRSAPIRAEYEPLVRSLIQSKGAGEYLVDVRYNTLKSAYYRAEVKGSHSFRHTYARNMLLNEFKNLGIAENEGRNMLQRMLENRAAGYRKDYLVMKQERTLYRKVNEAVDRIHSWLGHGKGRIELCETYMKGV